MAFVQSGFNQGTTGTTRSVTLGSNVAAGELVVAFLAFENGADLTVTWSNSGTATVDSWTEVAGLDQLSGSDVYGQEVAYARVTGAGTLTVTGTIGSAPAWAGIGVGTWNDMPGTLELQDSQYDRVTINDPDGSDMTPTSQPAMVIGWGLWWSSPIGTLGADTAAGFSDGGSGATYTGTALLRLEYQRITSTAALDIEFTGTSTIAFLSGLIFTEAGVPSVTLVNPQLFYAGQTGIVITGTTFEASQGTGSVRISPTDNVNDAGAVTQTVTAWGDTSITFTAVKSTLGFGTLYLFVTNDSGDSNASGFPVSFIGSASLAWIRA